MSNVALDQLSLPAIGLRIKRPDFGKIFSLGILFIGALGMVLPFIWMVITSLKSPAHAYDLPPTWIPTEFRWSNYANAIRDSVPILQNLLNSTIIALSVSLGMIITAPLAGYAFARLRFPGNNALFICLLASLMVPMQVTIIPLFLIMRALGLINNLLSLILLGVTGALGVFLMRQFFLTIPEEILEAAVIDGAKPWDRYRLVALPLAKNGVSTLGVITFLGSWNSYFAPSIFLNDIHTATMPLALVLMLGPFGTGSITTIMAATTIAIAPAFIFFLIAQNWIIDSLTNAGVKG